MGILWRKNRVNWTCFSNLLHYDNCPLLGAHSFLCAKHFNGKNSASHILCQRWFLKYLWGGVLSRKTCLLISTPESHLYSCKKCLIDSAEFLERKHLSSLRLLFVAMSFFRQMAYNATAILQNVITTLQYMMDAKLSKQRFWHCHENGLIKTVQTMPHNLLVSVKSSSLYWGLG